VTDPVYAWRGLRFVAPAGWRDDTLVTLTGPGATMNLTVSQDTLSGPVDAYARAQEAAVAAQRLAGYRAQAPQKVRVGTVDAVVCERELHDARGQPLVQRQAFVVVVAGTVVIVTATARATDKAAASAALDGVVSSLGTSAAGAPR